MPKAKSEYTERQKEQEDKEREHTDRGNLLTPFELSGRHLVARTSRWLGLVVVLYALGVVLAAAAPTAALQPVSTANKAVHSNPSPARPRSASTQNPTLQPTATAAPQLVFGFQVWPVQPNINGVFEGLLVAFMVWLLAKLTGHFKRFRTRFAGEVEITIGEDIGIPAEVPQLVRHGMPPDFNDVGALLSWQVTLAPLIGRDAERDALLNWARDSTGHHMRIRLLTGPGGSGKSRLAAEVARELQNERKWWWRKWPTIGAIGRNLTKISRLPAFVIIDDPEDRQAAVCTLMKRLEGIRGRKRPVRILLLSRDIANRWETALKEGGVTVKPDALESRLAPLTSDDAATLYYAVTQKLATHFERKKPAFDREAFDAWLKRDDKEQLQHLPLYLTAAAIHSVELGDERFSLNGRDVIRELAERECDRLVTVSTHTTDPSGARTFYPKTLTRLAAIAITRRVLTRTALEDLLLHSAFDLMPLAAASPTRSAQVDAITALPWFNGQFWRIGAPPVVQAAILFTILQKEALSAGADAGYPPMLLWEGFRALGEADTNRLGQLGFDIGTIFGPDAASMFAVWTARVIGADSKRAHAVEPILRASPLPPTLRRLGVRTYELLAAAPGTDADKAVDLGNLSNCRSGMGDRAGALSAIEEAVGVFRELAAELPATYRPDVAMSLNNLSNCRSGMGDRAGALSAVEEAVGVFRELAAELPATYRPDLAMSLNNLSGHRSEMGDRAGALSAIEEAVAIRRELAAELPATYRPNLAASLNNLSNHRSEMGDHAGALSAIEEAVAIRRELAAEFPTVFERLLASSLGQLARCLRESGEGDRARAASDEAAEIEKRNA